MATKPRTRTRSRSRDTNPKGSSSGAGLGILLLLAVLFGVHLGKVYLARQTTLMGLSWEQKSKQLATLKKEQANLQVEKETYTDGDYILRHAHDMGLRPSQPGQVRRMLPPSSRPASTTAETVDATALDAAGSLAANR